MQDSWCMFFSMAVGMGISLFIKALQYVFYRGFAEVDDVMHNTVGCILGYLLVKGSRFIVNKG